MPQLHVVILVRFAVVIVGSIDRAPDKGGGGCSVCWCSGPRREHRVGGTGRMRLRWENKNDLTNSRISRGNLGKILENRKISKIFKIFRIFRWKNRRKKSSIFFLIYFRFGARKMRCGMCLSTHRASFKKVWERFYVGEFSYPLSKSKIEGKSGGNSRIFWNFQIFRGKNRRKNRGEIVEKIFFGKIFFGFVTRKMRCGMWLSTHRASVEKVWERFYVAEFFYPLSKSHWVYTARKVWDFWSRRACSHRKCAFGAIIYRSFWHCCFE